MPPAVSVNSSPASSRPICRPSGWARWAGASGRRWPFPSSAPCSPPSPACSSHCPGRARRGPIHARTAQRCALRCQPGLVDGCVLCHQRQAAGGHYLQLRPCGASGIQCRRRHLAVGHAIAVEAVAGLALGVQRGQGQRTKCQAGVPGGRRGKVGGEGKRRAGGVHVVVVPETGHVIARQLHERQQISMPV